MSKTGLRKTLSLFLSILLTVTFVMSSAFADDEDKTVRVGWFESPFNITDDQGRRSGYSYEYQRKIAAYTGWNYEYVEGSWIELFHMLECGEIDMLSDVSYTPERAEEILYPSIPMGQEDYYIYIPASSSEIKYNDLSTLSGKYIGVTKGSVQEGIFRNWAEERGLDINVVELEGSEDESLDKMLSGELDAFVTLDSYGNYHSLTPVAMVGSSDFYFAVSKDRPDLLSDLESALFSIQEEDKYYAEHLYDTYLNNSGTESFLSNTELDWLEEHGPIRIGYQDNYLAFCAKDPETGELTGALKDYLEYLSTCLSNAEVEFEAVSYPTAAAAMSALLDGEIDLMFPANFTDYYGELQGFVVSQPLMRTGMLAVVRESDQQSFSKKDDIIVAINAGNPNYELFVENNFPDWTPEHYLDTPACLQAVANGEADCILISNYRYNNISDLCKSLKLTTLSTGVDLDYCFAIKEGNTTLYSIMGKLTTMVPDSVTNASLNYYSTEDAKVTFWDYIKEYFTVVMTVLAVILVIIVLLLANTLRLEHKATEEEQHSKDLSKRVNYDALTSVRNKGAFTEYLSSIKQRIESGEEPDVAVCIFDCNDLKFINDKYGHTRGDEYIKNSCHFICTTFRHSAVFRIGGDEFAAVVMNNDFLIRDELISKFTEQQEAISREAEEPWNKIKIAMGIAVYDKETDTSLDDTVSRADALMYENKKILKGTDDVR